MYHGVYHLHRAGIARCAALSRVTVTLRGRNISPFGAIRSSVNYETSPSSLVNSFPVRVQPYLRLARLDRPIGSWLLFWPCAWSIGLASDPATIAISLGILGKFGLGTVVMRGAGCTINDLWDRDFDKQVSHLSSHHHQLLTAQVARTVFRPLANGSDAAPSNILCVCASPRVSCAMIECYLYWLSDSNTASPTDS